MNLSSSFLYHPIFWVLVAYAVGLLAILTRGGGLLASIQGRFGWGADPGFKIWVATLWPGFLAAASIVVFIYGIVVICVASFPQEDGAENGAPTIDEQGPA